MGKKQKQARILRRNLLGVLVFVAALPVLWPMGGAVFALQEILPGQVQEVQLPQSETVEAVSESDTAQQKKEKGLLSMEDITFEQQKEDVVDVKIAEQELQNIQNFEYLKKNYYVVDSRTVFLPEDIDTQKALTKDFTIDKESKEPQVLIFHTHASEAFADSDMSKGLDEGIWGVGEHLKEILETKYGISVLHHDGVYDVVNGKGKITGAYERMEPPIRQILEENPSIKVCIDMHRDGVAEGTKLVTNVNGKDCAQVMFFNGLCRLNQDGRPIPAPGLSNPYIEDNLAFSLQMQMQANARFPNFSRRIYLNAYRFSLHMKPRSTLIEVGAQTNTKQEARNAMEPLAEVLAAVLLEDT